MPDIGELLIGAGMSEYEATAKARLHTLATDSLTRLGASAERDAFFVPGRIEILGKHTDYAGGRSILCAVPRGFIAAVAPRHDRVVRVVDVVRDDARTFTLDTALEYSQQDWGSYVAACLRRLARNFPGVRGGADVALASDLPQASGMSSSSALSTAIFFALDAVNNIRAQPEYRAAILTREDLAGYLGTIENGQNFGTLLGDRGVGTFGGSEDHTAIICCRSGFLSQFSFSPVRFESEISCPPCVTFVVAFSGVAAEKGAAAQKAYNDLSLQVQRIVALWNSAERRSDTSLAHAVASATDAPQRIRSLLRATAVAELRAGADAAPRDGDGGGRMLERFEQFVNESNEIIPAAAAAFARGDLAAFGELVDRSQRGAELGLRNQIPETVALVRSARKLGAHAASAFGGGFGGSVWALVEAELAQAFMERWRRGYVDSFPNTGHQAQFFLSPPGPSAMRL